MNGVISGHGHPGHRSIAESLERSAATGARRIQWVGSAISIAPVGTAGDGQGLVAGGIMSRHPTR